MLKNKKNHNVKSEAKQVGRFGLIGIINTVIDFGLYNLLITLVSLAVIPANIISASVAMSFSFVANKTFVFRSSKRSNLTQAATFLAVTAFSVYAIQNASIYVFKFWWPAPFELAHDLLQLININLFSEEFVINNGAKAFGVGFGMVWNYLWYKKIIFKK